MKGEVKWVLEINLSAKEILDFVTSTEVLQENTNFVILAK